MVLIRFLVPAATAEVFTMFFYSQPHRWHAHETGTQHAPWGGIETAERAGLAGCGFCSCRA